MVAELSTAVTPAPMVPVVPAAPTVSKEQILKALNLDPKKPEVQALVLVCQRYDLDPLLKHALLISGSLYVTRDGLLHVAHRSGVFNGMEVEQLPDSGTHFISRCSVWRKDMQRPFTFTGRYPKNGRMAAHGPEMADKVAVCRTMRHAFDVSLCSQEETWEQEEAGQASGITHQTQGEMRNAPPVATPAPAPSRTPASAPLDRMRMGETAPEPVTPPEAEPVDKEPEDDPNYRRNLLRVFAKEVERLELMPLITDADGRIDVEKVKAFASQVAGRTEPGEPSNENLVDATMALDAWQLSDAAIPTIKPLVDDVKRRFWEEAKKRGFDLYGSKENKDALLAQMYHEKDVPSLYTVKDWNKALELLTDSKIKREVTANADTLL